ncbi:MAG: hypothetical protein J6S83_03115 [Lachnospiraceae bacterium]|nr:hypothetical protein [Lachnospiraceae bacterium]
MSRSKEVQKGAGLIRMGPGAASLILIFVMLALSILAMLTLVNAKNDEQISVRSARVTEAVYDLEAQAQRIYGKILYLCREADEEIRQDTARLSREVAARVNEEAGDGMPLLNAQEDTISWTVTDGVRSFECTVRLTGEDRKQAEWILHRMNMDGIWTEDEWNF